MALERIPEDIRVVGGVARMSDPAMVEAIMEAVTIPVMAKVRIGYFKGEAGTGDIVEATKHCTDPLVIAEASKGLGGVMFGCYRHGGQRATGCQGIVKDLTKII